jgi:hypothetical protein
MVAFQLAGRATRDALWLSTFDLTTLPAIVIVSSVFAALVCIMVSRLVARVGPARLVPAFFFLSAVLLLGEWGLAVVARPAAAVVFYLHFGALGALLISGFWALVSERFDPRTARRVVGRILLGATLGGLIGGLVPARVGTLTAMFPILAVLHAVSALFVLGIRPVAHLAHPEDAPPAIPARKAFMDSPYLRGLVLLVVLTAASEGLLDYVFKLRVTAAGTNGEALLKLFAGFYTVTALASIVLQVALVRPALTRLGIARTAALLPAGVSLGALGGLVFPGLLPMLVARGSEITLRGSVFKGAYELLFTPVGAAERRATKLLVDVGASRLGDAAGGVLLQATLVLAAGAAGSWLLAGVVALSVLAALVASRLHRGYVASLARGLERGLPMLESAGATLLQTFGGFDITALRPTSAERAPRPARPVAPHDPLASRDPAEVRSALAAGLGDETIERAIALLAWDEVAPAALAALRGAPPAATAAMVAHLLDPGEDFTIRRRLVPALAERPGAETFEGLLRAVKDRRFEVRYRAARALAHLRNIDPRFAVDEAQVLALVLEEVSVERAVWEGRRLLDESEEPWAAEDAELLRQRAGRAMEHVFVLLSLVLPRAPLRLAYRGLQVDDPRLRGTALDYLESVLPERVRVKLWPFLEPGHRARQTSAASAEVALQRLLASTDAIRRSTPQ